ncbi:MAG: AAA family ATPase [Saccharofermentans sp.]|nr:AAA family ATPase [Saccharofermentans sp.]
MKGIFAGNIVVGADYEVTGSETTYKGKPQIVASAIKEVDKGSVKQALIATFLDDNFAGIGPKTSVRLAEVFGEEVLEKLLEQPENVAKEAPGLSSIRAMEISGIIDENIDKYNTLLKLRLYELGHAQSVTVWNEYGTNAIGVIEKNPYAIMRCKGIGFESCDRIADIIEFNLLDPNRFEGAIVNALNELHESSGNTYFEPSDVRNYAMQLLGKKLDSNINPEIINSIMDEGEDLAVSHKSIVIYRFVDGKCAACKSEEMGARVALKHYFQAELTIKREIESFLKANKIKPNKEKALQEINEIAKAKGVILDDTQSDAVFMSMFEPISIITGGPGTGKTTITGILADYFKKKEIDYAFCAPTGRAAKRLSEASGVKATTIHRLLEINGESQITDGDDFMFGRGPENPIDARVILVDETSMVDTELFKSLLLATRKDASIILVGDPDQLPSVGPGNLLSDLLSCEAIPRVSLTYVFRQENESSIASNSRRILEGQMPIGNDDDFKIITVENDEEACEYILNLSSEAGIDSDSVILCPTKQQNLGTVNLNLMLQKLFGEFVENNTTVSANLDLYLGDKVMQVKNNYKIEYFDVNENEITSGIYNGEIGVVKDIDFMLGGCDILFDDGRCVKYDRKTLADVELAYAMTVHKAQGCEFDTVIIALGKMNHRLSNRKLLYTAVTRGKKNVVIIDSGNRLRSMIASGINIERNTSLKDFLSIVSHRYI